MEYIYSKVYQQLNLFLMRKSLIERGMWYNTAITPDRWPKESQAGGFCFSTASTVFFANSSVGVDLMLWESIALARIASSNFLYNFNSGNRLYVAMEEFPILDFTAPGTTLITSIPKGRSSSLHKYLRIVNYKVLPVIKLQKYLSLLTEEGKCFCICNKNGSANKLLWTKIYIEIYR